MTKIILVILTSATASVGNSLLKSGAMSFGGDEPLELRQVHRAFLTPAILGGIALYAISQLLWITMLRIADLSLAYPLMIGFNFVLIMTIAWTYFKEPVSLGKLSGVALIFTGIALVVTG
ncbi:MAG: SMR family transporter [Thermoleophilia bacterium]|nr:SMR family transporter [Thermoleophilia bacterium]